MMINEFRIRWKVVRGWTIDGRCHFASELGHSRTGMAVRGRTFKEGFWGSGWLATKNNFFGWAFGEVVDVGVELRGFGRRDIKLHTGGVGTTEDFSRKSRRKVRKVHGFLIIIIGRKSTSERG